MKAKFCIICSVLLISFIMSGCKSPSVHAFYTFDTECMSNEMDGSVVLRAWGQGSSRSEAMEKAKRQAVYDVIFSGIRIGQCNLKPLVFEVNAKEKYESYFNDFFRDGGEYEKFLKMDATKMGSGVKAESKTRDSYAVVVRVLRANLERKLITDNIIKK